MAGPPTQQRYNAKARGSVAGGSHKKRKRPRTKGEDVAPADEGTSGRGKMSAKKRKRLDSYITKKLKNEEKVETLKLLASLTPSTSTLAALASTSTLGQKPLAPSSAQERSDVREDIIVRRGIDRMSKNGKARGEESESDGEDQATRRDTSNGTQRAQSVVTTGKTKTNGKQQSSWNPALLSTQPQSESSNFDSSDSDDDASPEESAVSPLESSSQLVPAAIVSTSQKAISGGAMQTSEPAKRSLGGALKTGPDGQADAPKVMPRRQKMPLGRSSRDKDVEISASSSSQSSDEEESDSASSYDADFSSEDQTEDDPIDAPAPKRALGFKAWALKQMGQETPASPKPSPPPFAREPNDPPSKHPAFGPLGTTLSIPVSSLHADTSTSRPTIKRRESVSEARLKLPILAEEQGIVEAIRMNPVVIIAGETGSGKTTQVPQMLYEAGFGFKGSSNPGMIAVTQPRRVAAVSLSARVRDELNLPASLVAHQIRYSSTTSPETCIKFMTDGVLLREMATDFLLSRYSVVIVDEAHERGVNTDVLIGLLSRVAKLREKKWRETKETKPLRIVIMSATLRISDFSSNTTLFATPPPVVHIPARQHPVTTHFSRKTVGDYVGEAYKKVCKIHARLPPGGVLVFLTGQGEIQGLCRKLEARYGQRKGPVHTSLQGSLQRPLDAPLEAEDVDLGQDDLAADVDDGDESDSNGSNGLDDDIPDVVIEETDAPMHILPLYSLLPNDQQMRVFQPPPPGHRLVIVSTNVAETSVTIPGIRYVVDSGRSKDRHFDPASGVQTFQVSWISKASAAQRSGRAGRTGPGHVYRLYSSALFEDHFEAYSKPEILRMPIEGVVLQMKSMNIDSVVNFPFPTPPDRASLSKAEGLLIALGALEKPTRTKMIRGTQQVGVDGGRITTLGNAMAGYPVSPRFAKMLVIGNQHDCLPFVIAIVACLSVGDLFVHEQSLELGEEDPEMQHITRDEVRQREQKKQLRSRYFKAQSQFTALGAGKSDIFKMLAAVGAYEYDPSPTFCSDNFLRHKAMHEIQQLRRQISRIANVPMARLAPPSETQLKVFRQIILASSLDRVAVRLDIAMKQTASFTSSRNIPYRALDMPASEAAFIHPSSTHLHHPPPEYLVFQELTRGEKKTYMRGITTINPGWLSELGKTMCSWSKPEEVKIKGRTQAEQVKNGERDVWVVPHFGDLGVDLPPRKMRQRREGTRWVLVE